VRLLARGALPQCPAARSTPEPNAPINATGLLSEQLPAAAPTPRRATRGDQRGHPTTTIFAGSRDSLSDGRNTVQYPSDRTKCQPGSPNRAENH
jgi:hypothetical protein